MTDNTCPLSFNTEKEIIVKPSDNLKIYLNLFTLFKTIFHVSLVFGMEELEATLPKQLRGRITQQTYHSLIDETEFAVHGMTGDELCRAIGTCQFVGVGRRRNLESSYRHQTTVRRMHIILGLPLQLHSCEHI